MPNCPLQNYQKIPFMTDRELKEIYDRIGKEKGWCEWLQRRECDRPDAWKNHCDTCAYQDLIASHSGEA